MLLIALITSFYLNATEDNLNQRALTAPLFMLAQFVGLRRFQKPLLLVSLTMQLSGHPYLANHSIMWVIFAVWILLGGSEYLPCVAGVVYFAAGFHKLNSDFFDPMDGCAADFASRLLREFSGLGNQNAAPHYVRSQPFAQDYLSDGMLLVIGIFVVGLELVCGLAIVVSTSRVWQRRAFLFVFLTLHTPTALISFYDFGSVATCGLLALHPHEVAWSQHYWSLFHLEEHEKGKGVMRYCRRICILWLDEDSVRDSIDPDGAAWRQRFLWWYMTPNVLSNYLLNERKFLAIRGLIWLMTVLPILLPLWKRSEDDARLKPSRGLRSWGNLLSVLLVGLYTAGPYIGLHTAGAFTMFSNLRVNHDGTSNHWLIPRTVIGLQSDVMRVVELKPAGIRSVRHLRPGQVLPRWQLEMAQSKAIWRIPEKNPEILAQEPASISPELLFAGGKVKSIQPAPLWKHFLPFQFRPGPWAPGCSW